MSDENIVYVKTKNGIFKCYKSEQMHHPIYYPVKSKTNGYIDYNEVEKILTIEDLYQENQELKNQLEEKENQQKQFIEWLEDKLEKRKKDIKLLGQDVYTSKFAYEENLSKYKEIIGGNNDR